MLWQRGWFFILFLVAQSFSGDLEVQFSLFTDNIQAGDSILSVERVDSEHLALELRSRDGSNRKISVFSGIPGTSLLSEQAALKGVFIELKENEKESSSYLMQNAHTRSGSRSNKVFYVGIQTLYGAYLGGGMLPLLLSQEERSLAFLYLSTPIALGGHLYSVWEKPIHDASLVAVNYYTTTALTASMLLPWAVVGPSADSESGMRVSAGLSLATYPLSLWYAQKQGEAYADNPGRLSLLTSFSLLAAGHAGFASSHMIDHDWFSSRREGQVMALSTLGAVGTAYAATWFYKKGEYVSEGYPRDLLLLSLLGMATTAAVGNSLDWKGGKAYHYMWGGFTLGQIGGFMVKHNCNDSYERASYNTLGALAGYLFGLGLPLLVDSENSNAYLYSSALSAWLGYGVMRYVTRNMLDDSEKKKTAVQLSLSVIPIYGMKQNVRGEQEDYWKIPGLLVKF
jgi:hypothetical protein